MKFSNAEVAQVLEDAADLYESDKVEWCKNSWGGAEPFNGGVKLTGCASTSLGLAIGLGVHVPGMIDSVFGVHRLSDEELDDCLKEALVEHIHPGFLAVQSVLHNGSTMRYTLRGVRLYKAVRKLLDEQVRVRFNSSTVPTFNDRSSSTKEQVIDLFKETAKDLRNA